jgi:hypothetical protein
MKKILFLAVLIAFPFYPECRAQGPNDLISKDNLSIDLVRKIFENSYYEVKDTAANYFSIKDVFTVYVDLDKDLRYITLSVYWPVNENFTPADKFELLNKIGKDVLLVTPYFNDAGNSLTVKTTIWVEGGTTARNIVLTEKLFVKALNLVLDKDTNHIIK